MLSARQLDLAWEISTDRVNWCVAAKVKNLSASLEAALAAHLPTGPKYRNLTRKEVVALFLDKFVLNNERFRAAFPFMQPLRKWWAKLTLPKDFVIAEVTAEGVRYEKY